MYVCIYIYIYTYVYKTSYLNIVLDLFTSNPAEDPGAAVPGGAVHLSNRKLYKVKL